MFKLITDRKTAQEAIAKVKEALANKEKQQPKEKEETKGEDEVIE